MFTECLVSPQTGQILPGILGVRMYQLQVRVLTQTNLKSWMLRGNNQAINDYIEILASLYEAHGKWLI